MLNALLKTAKITKANSIAWQFWYGHEMKAWLKLKLFT
jgi:hypothetical protein